MAHRDRYLSFQELFLYEREGVDYRILINKVSHSSVTVVAPHGGGIERGTSQIAQAIAGSEFNLYHFEGLKAKGNFRTLHITSRRFDEPRCVELVVRSQTVVTIHGCVGKEQSVYIGGLDDDLRMKMAVLIRSAGFDAHIDGHRFPARDRDNICNRGLTGKGVQLEITGAIRNNGNLKALAAAVRSLLLPLNHYVNKA